jgi:NifU-like N terminal domain
MQSVAAKVLVNRGGIFGSSKLSFVRSIRAYHDNIVEHYENPRNVGSLDKNDSSVGTVSLAQNFSAAVYSS